MAKRIEYLHSELTKENYKHFTNLFKLSNEPYLVTRSNYTLAITSDWFNVKLHPQMSKMAFIAGAMLKRDIKKTGLSNPDISKDDLSYFEFAAKEKLENITDEIYNIDIKSAYLNVLNNHGLLSVKTYSIGRKLSKRDRLAMVGMLASRKDIFEMIGNKTLSRDKVIADTCSWFYFCVNRTNEIMADCKKIIGNDFLFFWVDGIFFTGRENIKPVTDHLRAIGYRYSLDVCNDMIYSEINELKKLRYHKGDEYKELYLPKKNNKIDEFLINLLYL